MGLASFPGHYPGSPLLTVWKSGKGVVDVNKKWPKFADLKARFRVLFKQLEEKKAGDEEEKEDGFSDQCSETTCKTRKEERGRRVSWQK